MRQYFQQILVIIFLVLLIAALPTIILVDEQKQTVEFQFSHVIDVYSNFFEQLAEGGLGKYQLGSQYRDISEDITDNFRNSLLIMLVGVSYALIISILFGIFISRFKMTKVFNFLLNTLSVIPDFILIILSMIIAIKIYKYTGIRLVSLRPDAGALNIWFPMILVGIAPTLYLFKVITVKYYQTSGEDYIRTAVAKGLQIDYVNLHHVFKNIEPYIKAELIKVISLAIGNLFIVEYLLNVSGITKFIFQANDTQPIIIGLFSMLFISIITFSFIKLLFYLFKRGFIYE